MTSTNIIEYTIFDKEDKQVGTHRQNIMCSKCNDGLEKFQPAEEFTIQPWGYDEEDDEWEGDRYNLKEWLVKNPAQLTFRKFKVGEEVRVFIKAVPGISKNRREVGVVKDVIKGMFFNGYKIELSDRTLVETDQTNILPKL